MSLRFSVAQEPQPLYTHQLAEICTYLTEQVVVPFLNQQGVRWEARFQDFFKPDEHSHPFEATGTIDFLPPPLFLGQLGQLENAMRDELGRLGIRVGLFAHESYPDRLAVRCIHIPILENPTVQQGPPEVNMSNTAGRIVLRDLLGFASKAGRYEFTATDILDRVCHVKTDDVQKFSTAALVDPQSPGKRRPLPSRINASRIHRCLEELAKYARWAADRQHEKLSATETSARVLSA
ncbi:MAG: hypothetical protein ACYDC1_00460 [Limisphaerales bacterium]